MSHHDIVAAHTDTDEASDALALAALLAEQLGEELVVARVLGLDGTIATDRNLQREVRATVGRTREAVVAAVPAHADAEIVPLPGASVSRRLHALAREEDAGAIVVGSTHHRGAGRLLLGGAPEVVANGAPCPVFVASPGFRHDAQLHPPVVGVAYDGTAGAEQALALAVDLAGQLGLPLRIVTVHPSLLHRTRHSPGDAEALVAAAAGRVAEGGAGLAVTTAVRAGDPAHELCEETREGSGLLVLGSHHRGLVGRALLGSVSGAVIRGAHAPVVIAPRG